jgi:hypothetical protein
MHSQCPTYWCDGRRSLCCNSQEINIAYETKNTLLPSKCSPLVPIMSHANILHTPSHTVSVRSSLILSSRLRLSHKHFSNRVSRPKFCMHFSCPIRGACSASFILLDLTTLKNISERKKLWSSSLCSYSILVFPLSLVRMFYSSHCSQAVCMFFWKGVRTSRSNATMMQTFHQVASSLVRASPSNYVSLVSSDSHSDRLFLLSRCAWLCSLKLAVYKLV